MYYVKPLNNDRITYLNLQTNHGIPSIYCCCNNDGNNIEMLLTKHKPTPHFQTRSRLYDNKHYLFCPHYINKSNTIQYIPAITYDENGEECAKVDFNKTQQEIDNDIDEVYRNTYKYIRNSNEHIYKGKMTFDAFVKYKNMTYFLINQYTNRIINITDFNNKVKGYINFSNVNNKCVKDLGRGNFIYKLIHKIELNPFGNYYYVYYEENKKYSIKKDLLDIALLQFQNTFNNLSVEQVISNNECNLIFYGFVEKKGTKYPKFNYDI